MSIVSIKDLLQAEFISVINHDSGIQKWKSLFLILEKKLALLI